MPNHPSRGWRRRAHQAMTWWMARWRWPKDPTGEGRYVLTLEQLREMRQTDYLAGYEAGRLDGPPRAPREVKS